MEHTEADAAKRPETAQEREGRARGNGGGRDVFHPAVGYACLFHNLSEKSVLIIYYFLIILFLSRQQFLPRTLAAIKI